MPQYKLQVLRISDVIAASLERRILEASLKPAKYASRSSKFGKPST